MKAILLILICCTSAFSQCAEKVFKKHKFEVKTATNQDSSSTVLHAKAWGKVSSGDIINYFKSDISEKEFNCIVEYTRSHYQLKHDLVIAIEYSKKKNGKSKEYKKAFNYDVWRALIYQQ